MKMDAICLLLVGCCLGLASSTGNDFKLGKKSDYTVGVQPRGAEKSAYTTPPSGEVNWCRKTDDRCPLNVCEQAGRVCCWCDSYCNWDPFGVIQPCFCCPEGHVCCSASKPLGLKSPTTCCPSNSECSPDGRSCLQKINSVPSVILTELCDSTSYADVNPKLPNKERSVPDTIW